jgi:SAM-dependent methyltransferase
MFPSSMKNLIDLVNRSSQPQPWEEGENIPWNDPAFSERMLKEHLSQAHDAASRRFMKIDRHVARIRQTLLHGFPTRILDLGCGPGLYTSRLARAGHECTGIDFSPASVRYAVEQAQQSGLRCTYTCQDIRKADYGSGFGLVMLIYGEFNVFKPADARLILKRAYEALDPFGMLLLEPSTFTHTEGIGKQEATWYSTHHGLFSDAPHVSMEEHNWDDATRTSTTRYFIVDAATAQITRYAATYQAYTEEDLAVILEECGFRSVTFYPSLLGVPDDEQPAFMAVTARK